MVEVHNSIITKAAKAVLAPLGFRRKGRSRIWLADHAYWLAVVEFQPSAWSKGSYLNVSAHWLWTPPYEDKTFILSFDYGNRVGPFIEFRTEEQFTNDAVQLAEIAAQNAKCLRGKFHSMDMVADALIAHEEELVKEGHGGHWYAYHAGVANALAGRIDDSARMFDSILDSARPPGSILYPKAQAFAANLDSPDQLQHELLLLINQHRAFFRYPAVSRIPI